MNDENLESKALCKVQQFHECSFCSNRRHAAGKQLVYIYQSEPPCLWVNEDYDISQSELPFLPRSPMATDGGITLYHAGF